MLNAHTRRPRLTSAVYPLLRQAVCPLPDGDIYCWHSSCCCCRHRWFFNSCACSLWLLVSGGRGSTAVKVYRAVAQSTRQCVRRPYCTHVNWTVSQPSQAKPSQTSSSGINPSPYRGIISTSKSVLYMTHMCVFLMDGTIHECHECIRAHGLLRLVRTDGSEECPQMALNASVVKPHSAGVLESS